MGDFIVRAMLAAQRQIFEETGDVVELTARVDDETFERLYDQVGPGGRPYAYTKHFVVRGQFISVRRVNTVVV